MNILIALCSLFPNGFCLSKGNIPMLRINKFSRLTLNDVNYFKSILPNAASSVLYDSDPAALAKYNVDWLKKYKGSSQCVLRPRSTEEVSQIIKYCNERMLAVVPQGGNTGLVGGSVPLHDEIIIALDNFNQIEYFSRSNGIVVVQAGAILQRVDEYLNNYNYRMPLDLGAKGSCQIGGNIATNAGGLRFLRYGSLHGSVIGLEAVLGDGTVLNELKQMRKDNTGYDLKQLFIGSEGTLGIITRAAIATPQLPKSNIVAVLGCSSFEKVIEIFQDSKIHLNEILSAFEYWDEESATLVSSLPNSKRKRKNFAPYEILIEVAGANESHNMEKLQDFLGTFDADVQISCDGKQFSDLWSLRESIPEAAVSNNKAVFKYDISLPLDCFPKIISAVKRKLSNFEDVKVIGYGHVGDGNLHLNVISSQGFRDEIKNAIEPFIYEYIRDVDGSVSAEHGIGLMKTKYLQYSKKSPSINLMKKIKCLFDPNGIMNPYKVIV